MKIALEILTKKWSETFGMQPYGKSHLHYNYEALVVSAMEEYANEVRLSLTAETMELREKNGGWTDKDLEFIWNQREHYEAGQFWNVLNAMEIDRQIPTPPTEGI